MLHRWSLKAEKIRNFSVMRLHSEKAPKTAWFYNIYSTNIDLLNANKSPSIFLGFSCFMFHDEIYFVCEIYGPVTKIRISLYLFLISWTWPITISYYLKTTLTSYKGIQIPLQPVKSDIISIFLWKNFRVSQLVFLGQKFFVRKKV